MTSGRLVQELNVYSTLPPFTSGGIIPTQTQNDHDTFAQQMKFIQLNVLSC